jgi:streptogramin lyase
MQTRPRISIVTAILATLTAGLLAGCSASFAPNPVQDDQVPIGNIQGTLHGGQQPVAGASIYLYAAGTTGYKTSATSLLKSASNTYEDGSGNFYVMTDANGNFSIGGDYTCVTGTQVYVVAVGGDSGNPTAPLNPPNPPTPNNTAIVQMAALGQCPAAGDLAAQVPYLVINEVTTVAFAYAVGGFATTPYNVSAAPSGATALANAFANATNIVNVQSGLAPAAPLSNANATNPQKQLNTLANILSSCVNTTSATSIQCTRLFQYATTSAGVQATDEGSAIFNIVGNQAMQNTASANTQAQNMTQLYNQLSGQTPFSPYLTSAPTDWTMPIVYKNAISPYGTNTVNGVSTITSGAFDIAADTEGNMWIGDEVNGAIEITPLGARSVHDTNKSGTAFGEVKGVAVAPSGDIWVSDATNNQITLLDSGGTAAVTTPAASGGLTGPAMIAFDSSGNGYVANDGNGTMSVFDTSGVRLYGVARTFGGNLNGPAWIALDSLGDAFLPSQQGTYLGGDVPGKQAGSTASLSPAYALAIDSSNYLWMPNNSGTAPWYLYQITCPQTFNSSGVLNGVKCTYQNSFTNGGGMNIPDRIALDGGGVLWIANQGAETVSAYKVISPGGWVATNGFTTGAGDNCLSATPDISGNIWTGNKDGSVTELLGLSTPTKAPYVPGNYQSEP